MKQDDIGPDTSGTSVSSFSLLIHRHRPPISPRPFLSSSHHVFQRYILISSVEITSTYIKSLSTAIREYDAKLLLAYWLERAPAVAPHAQVKTKFQYPAARVAQIAWDPKTNTITPDSKVPSWVHNTKLVAKPDQLIKRRGKAGLLALNQTWPEARQWIAERAGKPQKVCTASRFILYVNVYAVASLLSILITLSRVLDGLSSDICIVHPHFRLARFDSNGRVAFR